MILGRKNREHFWTRWRVRFVPRRNYGRSFRYYWKRILRLKATPHAIAAGVAAGAFASFTPFMGFHFILAFIFAWFIAGNMIAAALGTAVGNPLTFPAIWAANLGIGNAILGVSAPVPQHPHSQFGALLHSGDLSALWAPIIKPMLVGGIPLGLVVSAVIYALTRMAVAAFQNRRRARFAAVQEMSGKREREMGA